MAKQEPNGTGIGIKGEQFRTSGQNQFLLYTAPDGTVKVEVFVKDETVWLTQKALAELFGVKVPAINKHLKNIFDSGELIREATVSKMEIVRAEGSREVAREMEFYNLDAIIAVGYRVNSYHATQFRIWATKTLREFIIKGFVLDDERLKQGKQVFGKDSEVRCHGSKELPERGSRERAEPDCVGLSRSCGESSRAGHRDEDGALGDFLEPLFGVVELPNSAGQGQSERACGQAQSRGGI